MANRKITKKEQLLTRKEELLKEIKYYEARIKEARASKKARFYEDDSSDSDVEFCINSGMSMMELKLQQIQLLKCLRATEELTDVTIIQSEVNVVVTPPAFEGEAPITEDGLWREVRAKCRIDLVTFSITFYTHRPYRQFAPVSYRGLSVMLMDPVHEKELAHTFLPKVTTPSDAVEVIRSYADAYRARRTSLARLADRYADSLYMYPLLRSEPEGGYGLKCANLLRASWTLQNKWSPVSPFYHKLSFYLEYMDETYIKKITQAHRRLCDPALDTDDRTSLLAEIMDTCLEARRQMDLDADANSQNSNTNQKSEVENQNSERPSGQDVDAPVKASEIMGSPKSLPKKTKAKGKENVVVNERKRGSAGGSGEGTAKKAKTSHSAKDKIDKNSKNSNKKSYVSHNVNSKISSNEGVSKNEPENVDKGNKKTKKLPEVNTKARNNEANFERPSGQDVDAPVKASEIMGPPKSLPKKSKAKGKENVVVNETKRGSAGGSGEGTAKKAKTSHSAKDKIDKNSKNSNKKSYVSHNVNSKISSNEGVSKNEPENVDKGNKKTKKLPEVNTKARNNEANFERPSGQDVDAPVKASEIMGPPKSLPKKSKAKGKENVVVNETKRGSAGGSGEGTAKKAKTSHSAKDKIDKNSKNSNKKSYVSHNVNSKISSNEGVSKNEPENVDKGNKKTKKLPEVDTKARNNEANFERPSGQDVDAPVKASEIMGPPKSLPKKMS